MSKKSKIWIAVSISAVIAGALTICVGLFIAKFDFREFETVKYEEKTYEINEKFEEVEIDIRTADIEFAVSDDGKEKVVFFETDSVKYDIGVEDGVMKVTENGKCSIFDYVGVSFGRKVTLFLTEEEYGKVTVSNKAGDVFVPEGVTFGDVKIDVSAGAVIYGASKCKTLEISNSAGKIEISSVDAENIRVSSKTGIVKIETANVSGDIVFSSSTGSMSITGVSCACLEGEGKTGSIKLSNVIASGKIDLSLTTGSIMLDGCDAESAVLKTSTGSVTGTFLTDKIFTAKSKTGNVDVPSCTSGGKCEAETSTGSIRLSIAK